MTEDVPSSSAEPPGDIGEGTSVPVRIAAIAALGGLLFGYGTAVINGALSALEDRFQVDAGVLGFVMASALLGAAVGALLLLLQHSVGVRRFRRVAGRRSRVRAARCGAEGRALWS